MPKRVVLCSIVMVTLLALAGIIQAAPPTNPISGLTNTAKTATSVTLAWVNPDGATPATGAFVEGRVGTSENNFFSPVIANSYNSDANWGGAPSEGNGCRTVFFGERSPSNVTVSGLSPNTAYTFSAFPFSGAIWSYGSEEYNTTANPFLHVTTLAAEPTLAASDIAFSSVASTTLTLDWVRGNGNEVLVVMRAGAAPLVPSDGTAYTANAAFGSGDNLGSDSYVVYKGSGTTVDITAGLVANTTYYVTVIELDGSAGGENYLLSGRPIDSISTITAPPTVSAGNPTFSSVGANEMTLSWVNGNGSRRLILMKSGSAITSDPANGTNYTANSTYGNGSQLADNSFAVFDGLNGPVTVSGLNPSTTYYAEIFEYNGSGESTAYLTTSPGNDTNSTLAAEPSTQASALAFSSIEDTALTLNWANGNGSDRLVVMRANSAISGNPVDGTTYADGDPLGGGEVIYTGTGTSVTENTLSAGVLYYFRVYEFNGATWTYNYLVDTATDNPNSQRTLLGPPSLNVASDIGDSSFVASWSTVANATGYRLDVSTLSDCSGNYVGSYNNYDVGNNQQQVVSGLAAGTLYYFRVKAYSGTSTSSYSSIRSGQTVSAAPTAISATNMTVDTFHANWLASTGATNYFLDVATDESFASMVGGFNNLLIGNALTREVTGLDAAQSYFYRVRSQSTGGSSGNSSTITALTVPSAPAIRPGQYISTNSFQALWFQAEGATGYRLDASTNADFSTFVPGYQNLNVGLVTTYTIQNANLAAGVTNYYRTRAYNGSGTSTNSDSASVEQPTAVVLYYFELLRNGGDITVAWATASEMRTVGFQLYRLQEDDTWTPLGGLVPSKGEGGLGASYSVPDPDAVQGQAYTYKLVEYEIDGKENEYGPFVRSTTEFAFNPIRVTPEGMSLTWLSWKDESYDIYRALDPSAEYTLIASEEAATPPENTFIDAEALELPGAFYKIVLHEEAQ